MDREGHAQLRLGVVRVKKRGGKHGDDIEVADIGEYRIVEHQPVEDDNAGSVGVVFKSRVVNNAGAGVAESAAEVGAEIQNGRVRRRVVSDIEGEGAVVGRADGDDRGEDGGDLRGAVADIQRVDGGGRDGRGGRELQHIAVHSRAVRGGVAVWREGEVINPAAAARKARQGGDGGERRAQGDRAGGEAQLVGDGDDEGGGGRVCRVVRVCHRDGDRGDGSGGGDSEELKCAVARQ